MQVCFVGLAKTAHLGSLAQIRRELLSYHHQEAELLQRVEGVIQRQLQALGAQG